MLTSLNLVQNSLNAEAGKPLASMLEVNAVLTNLNLSDNILCGIDWRTGQGTYDASGIQGSACLCIEQRQRCADQTRCDVQLITGQQREESIARGYKRSAELCPRDIFLSIYLSIYFPRCERMYV